jgi:hypothetical protein
VRVACSRTLGRIGHRKLRRTSATAVAGFLKNKDRAMNPEQRNALQNALMVALLTAQLRPSARQASSVRGCG